MSLDNYLSRASFVQSLKNHIKGYIIIIIILMIIVIIIIVIILIIIVMIIVIITFTLYPWSTGLELRENKGGKRDFPIGGSWRNNDKLSVLIVGSGHKPYRYREDLSPLKPTPPPLLADSSFLDWDWSYL